MELPNGVWTPEIIFIDFAQTSMQDCGGRALLVSWMCVRNAAASILGQMQAAVIVPANGRARS